MNEQIVELYGDSDMARLKRRIKGWTVGLCVLAVAALVACIAMAASVRTENATRLELTAVAVSTVAGWIVIYGAIFVVAATRRELTHAEMLHREPRERVVGAVTVTKERLIIRKSITVRRVEVCGADGTRRLLVCESRAKKLAAGDAAAVYAAYGYIAAYEVKP